MIACGLHPRTALDRKNSSDIRLQKIMALIGACEWHIHDLSAVELDSGTGMPRFNMPLELGITLGAIHFGDDGQRAKRLLILDEQPHRYDASISDISGQDIGLHGNDPDKAIAAIRNWLAPYMNDLLGGDALADDYRDVKAIILQLIREKGSIPGRSCRTRIIYCVSRKVCGSSPRQRRTDIGRPGIALTRTED